MVMIRGKPILPSLTVLALTACSGNGKMLNPNVDIGGTWFATMTVIGGNASPIGTQFQVTFTLSQTGTTISGGFASTTAAGSVAGSVTGPNFSFEATENPGCTGSFQVSGVASSSTLVGTYDGSDCNGNISATFKASMSSP
jgi:hypothetical protein